ncbi:MAG: NEW3 domain-containing protein [Candidatus Limnocylindrales bacterium]|nr:NEW3 domain-containing protein [Candidatus Limnocylindrales bacterium]
MARSRIARLGLAGWILGLGAVLAAAPASLAANPVTLTTPYPAIEVAPGARVSLTVSIRTANAGRVDLALSDVPTDWTATIRGGGFLVNGVQSDGSEATEVTLDVSVPEGARSGVQRITLRATSDGSAATLAVDIRVTPNAAGEVSLTTDFPELKGSSDASFTFNLTLSNDTPDDLTFGVVASGPPGWTVDAKVTSQAQAASAIVKAGDTTAIEVTAQAPEGAAAGVFPISVDATSGDRTARADLSVEITGSYKLTLTTPDGRLSANASAGSKTDLSLVIQNTGTADVQDVKLSATAPTGWEVTFEPETVTVPAQGDAQVTAHLTPSGDAIAGDYVTTFRASSDVANANAEMRVTIETSLLWGVVGVGLIALVLAGLWWTFRRYGRR